MLVESASRLLLLSIHAESKSDLTAEDDHQVIVRFDGDGKVDLMVAFDDGGIDEARQEYDRLLADQRRSSRKLLADDLVMDDRRSLVSRTYVGIEESGPFMAWATGKFEITPARSGLGVHDSGSD